jgi:hypothetical protein
VLLNATASNGWLFMGWSGDASGDYTQESIIVPMVRPLSNTATFSDDADSDGLLNTNEMALGTDPRKADSDSDGMSDARELIAGTSPTNQNSILSVSASLLADGRRQLSWFGVQGRFYTFQYCDSLVAGDWQSYPFELNGSDAVLSLTDPEPASHRFYRVKVRSSE